MYVFAYDLQVHRKPSDLAPYKGWREGMIINTTTTVTSRPVLLSYEKTDFSGFEPYWIETKLVENRHYISQQRHLRARARTRKTESGLTVIVGSQGESERIVNLVAYYECEESLKHSPVKFTAEEDFDKLDVSPGLHVWKEDQHAMGWHPREGKWYPCQVESVKHKYCGLQYTYGVSWMNTFQGEPDDFSNSLNDGPDASEFCEIKYLRHPTDAELQPDTDFSGSEDPSDATSSSESHRTLDGNTTGTESNGKSSTIPPTPPPQVIELDSKLRSIFKSKLRASNI